MRQPDLKLIDQVRNTLRRKHYAYHTEKRYLHWIRRFLRLHDLQHLRNLGKREIEAFLTHLAADKNVAAATLTVTVPLLGNQDLSALLGHEEVKITTVYTHILDRGPMAVRSPLDHKGE